MAVIPCPQCWRPIEEADGFCGSCGAILDPELLDDGDTAPHVMSPVPSPVDEPVSLPPPPVMSRSDAPASDPFQEFLEAPTGAFVTGGGAFEEETGSHKNDVHRMIEPQAVLRTVAAFDQAPLSPFEKHVLSFLDGRRPLARLRKRTGLNFNDLKIAIGMLADRGAIEVVGRFVPDLRSMLDDEDLREESPNAVGHISAPVPASTPTPPSAPAQTSGGPTSGTNAGPTAGPSAALRARANLILEQALADLRAGKRASAVALMKMAAELAPDDPQIAALVKSWAGL